MLRAAKPEGKSWHVGRRPLLADLRRYSLMIKKIQGRRDVIGDYSVMLSPTWGRVTLWPGAREHEIGKRTGLA